MAEKLEAHEISCEGMKGRGCEERIEARLRSIPGIQGVKASHKDKKVKLFAAAGAKLDLGPVKTALAELGYRA
jgi:copper chaperone CopZ